VVAAAIGLQPRRSAHFPGRHQKNVIAQTARLDIVDVARDGMIERRADVIHAFLYAQVVDVLVHVHTKSVLTSTNPQPSSHSRRASRSSLPSERAWAV